ncbi:MAG: hypothetical protein ACAH21_09390 [Ramlibacter sp.]|nr:hypothetical protein [Ramlibacter sp.]
MKLLHHTQRIVARHLKQFNVALVTALAAMALTACGGAEPVRAASSLSRGVQQILQPSTGGVASSRPTSQPLQGNPT